MKKFILLSVITAFAFTSCDKAILNPEDNPIEENPKEIENIVHDGQAYNSDAIIYLPFNGDYNDVGVYGLLGLNHETEFVTDRFGNDNSAIRAQLGQYVDFQVPMNDDKLSEMGITNNANFKGDFSISMWVRLSSEDQKAYYTHVDIISKWGGPAYEASWHYGITANGSYEFWSRNDEGQDGYVGYENSMFDGRWHNIIYTFNSNQSKGSIFIDGSFKTSRITVKPRFNDMMFRVGARNEDLLCDFNGYIDDIMFFDRELSAIEIGNINLPVFDDVVYFDSDEAEDSFVHDGSAYSSDLLYSYYPMNNDYRDVVAGIDGTNYGTSFVTDRFGNPNSAIHTNGIGYVDVMDEGEFNFDDDFTLAAWVKSDGQNGHTVHDTHIDFLSKWGGPASASAYYLAMTRNGGIEAWTRDNSNSNFFIGREGNFHDGKWHNVVFTYKAGSQIGTLYIDGNLAGDRNLMGAPRTNTPNNLRIGARTDLTAIFNGSLDDIMIIKSHISQIEAKSIANAK